MTAGLAVNALNFDNLTADPLGVAEGDLWFRSDTDRFRVHTNGVSKDLIDSVVHATHTGDATNPHGTTLELARLAGDTFAGDVNMGTNRITGLANAIALTDAPSWGQVIDRIQEFLNGLDWQESVLSRTNTPPGGPAPGDRYLITAVASGAWATHEDEITEWNGSSWDFIVPDNGTHVPVENEANLVYVWNGSSWSALATITDHGALTGLLDDDHTQYHTDARALTWLGTRSTDDLPEGATNLYYTDARVSANADVAANSAHRLIVSGNPHNVTKAEVGLSNVLNTLHNFAAVVPPAVTDDGVAGYSIGSQWIDTVLDTVWEAVDVSTGAAIWKRIDNVSSVAALVHKAGCVPEASFALSGGRQKFTVAFSTAFPAATYSVTITSVTTANKTYAPVVESKTSGGFTINLGTATKTDLVEVCWQAIAAGESS